MKTFFVLLLAIPYVQCGAIRLHDPVAVSGSSAGSFGVNHPSVAVAPMPPPPMGMHPLPMGMHPFLKPETNEEQFKRADADKNGKLNFDEFLRKDKFFIEMKTNEFKRFDANNDGFVTESEERQFFRKMEEEAMKMRYQYLSGMLDHFDSNHDRKLGPQELKGLLQERYMVKPRDNYAKVFAKFDKNKDNWLDMDEFEFFERNVPFDQFDRIPGTFGGPGPVPMGKPIAMPMPAPVSAPVPPTHA